MASVEKQTIFEMPMREVAEITISLDGSWHTTITRIWGRHKEVDRHLFKIKDDLVGYRWFECNSQMGQELLSLVDEFGKGKNELHVLFNPLRVKEIQQPQKEFLGMWARFKRFVLGR